MQTERRLSATQPSGGSERCLLLIRAPSDREIYSAFRSLAARWRSQLRAEYLSIEGDVPLTAGLSEPVVPRTLERLLDADCEMIDTLAAEIGSLRITYVRSGGHAPFRESFFDEVRIETIDEKTPQLEEPQAVLEDLLGLLTVTSHNATSLFAELIETIRTKSLEESEPLPQAAMPPSERLA